MENQVNERELRQIGKGFINNQTEGIVGRTLTQAYVDQNKITYIKIGGQFIPLSEKHSYQPIS